MIQRIANRINLMIAGALLYVAQSAHAAGIDIFENAEDTVIDTLQGPTGTKLAIIMVIVAAILLMAGFKVAGRIVAIIVAIVLLVKAEDFVTAFMK